MCGRRKKKKNPIKIFIIIIIIFLSKMIRHPEKFTKYGVKLVKKINIASLHKQIEFQK